MSVQDPVSLGATASAVDANSYSHNITAAVPAGALVVVAVAWQSVTTAQTGAISGGGLTWSSTPDGSVTGTPGTTPEALQIYSALAPSGLSISTTLTVTLTSGAVTTSTAVIGACYLVGATGTVNTTASQFRTTPTSTWATTAATWTNPDSVSVIASFHDSATATTSAPLTGQELWDVESANAVGVALNANRESIIPGSRNYTGLWSSGPVADAALVVIYDGNKTPPRQASTGTGSSAAASVVNPTALTPGLPATRANGDLLVAISSCRSNTATPTCSAGWSAFPGTPVASVTGSGGQIAVFTRRVDGSESAPTVTWTGVTTGTSGDSSTSIIICYRYVDPAFQDGTVNKGTDAAITTTATIGSISPGFIDALVIGITIRINDTAHTWTPPTSGPPYWAERTDQHTTSGIGHSLEVIDAVFPAAGATGTTTVVPSNTTSSQGLSITLALAALRPRPRQAVSVAAPQQAAV